MHIVAAAAEPEFVKWEDGDCGMATLTIELANISAADLINPTSGSIQLQLLKADVETIERALAARNMKQVG